MTTAGGGEVEAGTGAIVIKNGVDEASGGEIEWASWKTEWDCMKRRRAPQEENKQEEKEKKKRVGGVCFGRRNRFRRRGQ